MVHAAVGTLDRTVQIAHHVHV